jgi:hypothetical protein
VNKNEQQRNMANASEHCSKQKRKEYIGALDFVSYWQKIVFFLFFFETGWIDAFI